MKDRFKYRIYDVENKKYIDNPEDFVPWDLPDGFIAEQCTGLKDKNGNLIFEGDVVKINGLWDACGQAGYSENKCVVEYDEEVAGFTPMCNYDCDCNVYHDADKCEVIGNVHKNEELLK